MTDAQLPDEKHDVQGVGLQTDVTYQQLVLEHHSLDERIRQLSCITHLTDQQQFEETSLKKRKLALKDRIAAMARVQAVAVGH